MFDLFSDVPASAAYFASYELIQRGLQGPDRSVFENHLPGPCFNCYHHLMKTISQMFGYRKSWEADMYLLGVDNKRGQDNNWRVQIIIPAHGCIKPAHVKC